MNFSSSESDTVDPINPIMKKGQNAVIVFGNTGTISSDESVVFYITDNEGVKTIKGDAIGPIKDEISLVVKPLLPMILAQNQFPVLAYLDESTEDDTTGANQETTTEDDETEGDPRLGVTYFIEDGILTFSANDSVEANSLSIKRNQPYALMDMVSNEIGTTTLSYQMGGFDGSTSITSHTTDPSEIYLAFPKNILTNSNSLATVQLLDSAGNPVYAKKDIQVKLVSNDESILKTLQELTIKSGEYFNTFELETMNEGKIELALLSEDFALSKYEINVVDISPILTLDLLGTMNWNERIEAKLSIGIPEIKTSLSGFQVEWITEGGEVKSMEEMTNNEGIAMLNIVANGKDTVSITAKVSGNGFSLSTLTKTATILNMPITEDVIVEESPEFELDMMTLMLIIIPVAVGGALFFLKRMDKLDLITDRIPIEDKFEEIKERISDMRNR